MNLKLELDLCMWKVYRCTQREGGVLMVLEDNVYLLLQCPVDYLQTMVSISQSIPCV